MTLEDRVSIPDEVVARTLGEETVILHLGNGVYYGLDPVGSRMWELLSQNGDLRSVLEQISQEYEVDSAQLERDLIRIVDELVAKGLLQHTS